MTWEDLEKKYGIKFKLANGQFRPINEWLDSIYLQFTPEQVTTMIRDIMSHDELFDDITVHQK